jgi:hypothetical protein
MPTPPYIKQNNKKPLQKTNELLHDVNETASQNTNLKNQICKIIFEPTKQCAQSIGNINVNSK